MHRQICHNYPELKWNLTSQRLLLLIGLLLGLLLVMAKPASASDPLGNTDAAQVSCASVRGTGGVPGGTCYKALVSCPGIADMPVAVKVNQPPDNSIGTVLFTVGGGGLPWYDVHFTYGALEIENVLNAGYTTVQFNFSFPPVGRSDVPFAGWLTGPGGPRTLACRWATLAQWVHDNIRQSNTPFCATGNSGGAATAGYAIANYGMGSEFNMLEETNGPPFSRIDNGCLCNAAPIQTPCVAQPISDCYLEEANIYLDPAYANKACSSAEKRHHSPQAGAFLHDSL